MLGLKRFRGKHEAYFASVALMATIYESRGDEIEAHAYTASLPDTLPKAMFKRPLPTLGRQPEELESITPVNSLDPPTVGDAEAHLKSTNDAINTGSSTNQASTDETGSKPSIQPTLFSEAPVGAVVSADTVTSSQEPEHSETAENNMLYPPQLPLQAANIPTSSIDDVSEPETHLDAKRTVSAPEVDAIAPRRTRKALMKQCDDKSTLGRASKHSRKLSIPELFSNPRLLWARRSSDNVVVDDSENGVVSEAVNGAQPDRTANGRGIASPPLTKAEPQVPGHLDRTAKDLAPLDYAAKAAAIRVLESSGTLTEFWSPNWNTRFLWAADQGHESVVRLLLSDWECQQVFKIRSARTSLIGPNRHRKVSVNVVDKDGRSALHIAATRGHSNIVQILVAHGATRYKRMAGLSPDAKNVCPGFGLTPFECAVRNRDLETVKVFLGGVSYYHAADRHGWNLLHHAAYSGDPEVFSILLETGLDPQTPSNDGTTCLHIAAMNGKSNIMNVILERHVDVERKDGSGSTPLLHAVSGGHTECVQLLESAGADTKWSNASGANLLHVASQRGHAQLIETLCSMGFALDAQDGTGLTPLHHAVYGCHGAGVEALYWLGASFRVVDNLGNSVLHIAAKVGSTSTIEKLIFLGADPNRQNEVGQTPIMLAAAEKHQEATKRLLAVKSDVDMQDSTRMTAFSLARANGRDALAQLLWRERLRWESK